MARRTFRERLDARRLVEKPARRPARSRKSPLPEQRIWQLLAAIPGSRQHARHVARGQRRFQCCHVVPLHHLDASAKGRNAVLRRHARHGGGRAWHTQAVNMLWRTPVMIPIASSGAPPTFVVRDGFTGGPRLPGRACTWRSGRGGAHPALLHTPTLLEHNHTAEFVAARPPLAGRRPGRPAACAAWPARI